MSDESMGEGEGFSSEEEARILEGRARSAKRARRVMKDDDSGLNINAFMDIMTIILVFLIDSYGNSPISVKAGPELSIPYSTSEIPPQDTMCITITRKAILVGDREVVKIKDGQVDKSHKRGGENSLYIQPLFDQLTEEVSRHKQMAALTKQPFEGVATIISDRTTPYRLVTEVMYTAGQAQLANFKFAIVKFGRKELVKKAEGN